MRRVSIFVTLLLWVSMAGCGNNTTSSSVQVGKVVKREGKPDIHVVAGEDEAMNAAIVKARSSFGSFVAAFKSGKYQHDTFSIKQRFVHANSGEHMWIADLKYDGKAFQGRLANEPYIVQNIKMGDVVKINSKEVSDWKYIDNGKLIGGYTIRVFTDKMSPQERKKIETQGGYKLD